MDYVDYFENKGDEMINSTLKAIIGCIILLTIIIILLKNKESKDVKPKSKNN